MVSFLGIKFGSNRKKARTKRDIGPEAWNQQEQISSEEGDFIEHSFPVPPNQPLARPSTSYSTHGTTTWRAPYAGNVAASSSMVDLAPPSQRRPSFGSLRHHASETTLKGGGSRPNISSPIGPPRPLALDMRPSSSGAGKKKDWVNPLDVHFGKGSFGSRPGTPRDGAPSRGGFPADLNQLDARSSHSTDPRPDEPFSGTNGYPSPPPSVKNSEGRLSPVTSEHRAPSTRPAAPSSLRRVNTADMAQDGSATAPNTLRRVNTAQSAAHSLPSPAVSEEPWEGPVIRNVHAKRDTLTFHSPRRRSFVKHIDQSVVKREQVVRSEEEKQEIKKRRQTEGFEGNFSAFNFGDGSQPPPIDTQIPLPAAPSKTSPRPSLERPESPVDVRRPSQTADERRSARQRGMSEAMTIESIEREEREAAEQNALQSPYRAPSWESRHTGNPSESSSLRYGHGTPSYDSMSSRPLRPRVDSDTRSPGTPTNMYASPGTADQMHFRSRSPRRSPSPDHDDEVPPPRLNPDGRSQSPLARGPIEGTFPVVRGLPRGRRPGPPPPIAIMPHEVQRVDGEQTATPASGGDGLGWDDRMDRHRSAIPAPLSPARPARHGDEDISPWISGPATPTTAPRLPSPTFPSLEKTISSSSENLAKSFELAARAPPSPYDRPLISPVASEFSMNAGRRVDATRAPPRPAPVTLPPSIGNNGRSATPTNGLNSPRRVTAGFI